MAVQELLVRLGLDSASFSKKLQGVSKEMKILDKGFEETMSQMKNFENTQEGLAAKSKYLAERMDLLQMQSKLCGDEISRLHCLSADLRNQMKEFSKQIDIVNKELEKNVEDLRLVSQEYNQIESRIKKLEKVKAVFDRNTEAIEKQQKKIQNNETAFEGLTNTIKKNEETVKKLQSENVKLNSESDKLKNKITQLTNEYNKTSSKLTEVQAAYKKVSVEYGENSEKAQKLKATMEKLMNTQLQQKKVLEILPSNVAKLNSEYAKNVQQIEKLTIQNKNMATTQDKLKENVKVAEAEINKLNTVMERSRTQLRKYGVETENLADAIKQVELALEEERANLKNTGEAVVEKKAKIEQLEKALKGLHQQYDKASRQLTNAQKDLQNATIKQKEFNTEINKTNILMKETEIDKMFSNLSEKASRLKELGDVISNVGNHIQTIGRDLTYSVSVPLGIFGAKATTTFMEVEERIRKVNAVFGGSADEMGSQFEYLTEKTRDFARQTEWSASEVGEAYEYMAMAGYDIEKATNSMIPLLNLASIGMLDLGTASDIVTDAITPFSDYLEKVGEEARKAGKEFNETEYMVDIFAQTIRSSNTNVELMGETLKYSASVAAEAGVSFDDLAVAIGVAANSGIKGSIAGTSLAQGITRLLAPTDNAIALMKEYSIEVARNADGSMNLDGTIRNLQKAFAGMSEETKVANAKVIFGQTALKGWLPLISASSEEFDKLSDAIANSSGATDEMMREIEKSFSYQMKMLQANIEDFLFVVGDALAPAIRSISEKIIEITQKFGDWVSKMQETNPQLLELIGKIGILAVVVPPVIMVFGTFVKSLGTIFSSSSKCIGSFIKFAKNVKGISNGTIAANKSVGLLAKGLGSLITTFGGVTVGITAAIAAIVAVITAIGQNEDALGWLIDKWGTFGKVVAVTCESISGVVVTTFKFIWETLKGLVKIIKAIITLDFKNIDDIFKETMGNIKNSFKKGMSDIKGESSRAISNISDMTKAQADELAQTLIKSQKKISNLTMNNYSDVAKSLTSTFKDLNDEMLVSLRGTSDTMAVVLNGIKENMSSKEITEQLEKNLKDMAKTGKYTSDSIAKDFSNAIKIIEDNVTGSATKTQRRAKEIIKDVEDLGKKSYREVAEDIGKTVEKMDEVLFKNLQSMGGTWGELFKGVTRGSDTMVIDILNNLKAMGDNGSEIAKKLSEGLQGEIDKVAKKVDSTKEEIEGTTSELAKNVGNNFATMLDTIKNGSDKGLKDVTEIFVNGLSDLDAQTIEKLRTTSDYWYAILDGTTNESGQLVENWKQQILWNLSGLSQKSPEFLAPFKDNLLQALVEMNIISAEEFEILNKTVSENVDEVVEATKDIGKKVDEGMTPKEFLPTYKRLFSETKSVFDVDGKEIETKAETTGANIEKGLKPEEGKVELAWKSEFERLGQNIFEPQGKNLQQKSEETGNNIEKGLSPKEGNLEIAWQTNFNNLSSRVFEPSCNIFEQKAQEAGNNMEEGLKPKEGNVELAWKSSFERLGQEFNPKCDALSTKAQETGDNIEKGIVPSNEMATKVGLELEKVNNTINEKSIGIKESTGKAGTEAKNKFDEELGKLGKDVKVDEGIIDMEKLNLNMQNAGKLSVLEFAKGWSENSNAINSAIEFTLSTLVVDFEEPLANVNNSMDGIVQKSAILYDTVTNLKNNINLLDQTGLNQLGVNIDTSRNKMVELLTKTNETKAETIALGTTSMSSLVVNIKDAKAQVDLLKVAIKNVITEIINLGNKKLETLKSQFNNVKKAIKNVYEEIIDVEDEVDNLNKKVLTKFLTQWSSLDSKVSGVSSGLSNIQRKISELNRMSFEGLINSLYQLNRTLGTVRSTANSVKSSVASVQQTRSALQSRSMFNMEQLSLATTDAFATTYARNGFDMSKYKTSGGYYTSKSMAGTGETAREINSQREQLAILKQQNELLKQLILATTKIGGDINLNVDLDGRAIAKSSAKYMNQELELLNKRKNRLGGSW